jgi:hypothetical protein
MPCDGGLSDACVPVQEDVVRLPAINNGLERVHVLLYLLVAFLDAVGLV